VAPAIKKNMLTGKFLIMQKQFFLQTIAKRVLDFIVMVVAIITLCVREKLSILLKEMGSDTIGSECDIIEISFYRAIVLCSNT